MLESYQNTFKLCFCCSHQKEQRSRERELDSLQVKHLSALLKKEMKRLDEQYLRVQI